MCEPRSRRSAIALCCLSMPTAPIACSKHSNSPMNSLNRTSAGSRSRYLRMIYRACARCGSARQPGWKSPPANMPTRSTMCATCCEAGAVDVQQADVTRCGGMTAFLQIAALCEAFHIDLSGHCAPALHLHPACAAPRLRHLEWFHDHARIEHMLFEGAPVPSNGADPARSLAARQWPDLQTPGRRALRCFRKCMIKSNKPNLLAYAGLALAGLAFGATLSAQASRRRHREDARRIIESRVPQPNSPATVLAARRLNRAAGILAHVCSHRQRYRALSRIIQEQGNVYAIDRFRADAWHQHTWHFGCAAGRTQIPRHDLPARRGNRPDRNRLPHLQCGQASRRL